jgi:M6 family metalloprotease-like protein
MGEATNLSLVPQRPSFMYRRGITRASTHFTAMSFDHTHYYRLTTRIAGREQALDVSPDGSGHVTLAEPAESSGQYWKLTPIADNRYALHTAYLGDGLSLTLDNQGLVSLSPTTLSAGQSWNLHANTSGTYALMNDLCGSQTCLRLRKQAVVTTRQARGRPRHPQWSLTKLTPIPEQAAIPDLTPAPDVYCPEGCTDFAFYARPVGHLKAVMLFVDFPDAPADACVPVDQATHLLGNGQAQRLFHDQSHGTFELTVDILDHLGWRRLSQSSSNYNWHDFTSHRQYIADAAGLFAGELDFSTYQFVLIVAPPNAGFPDSPAFNARPGQGASSASGEIRLAVTFGQDSYRNSYINLVHEVSHLMGLPDLYPYGAGVDTSRAGCWDIMSDIFHCTTFLGWHRHKNGWLNTSRTIYLSESPQERYITLSPLSSRYGISMVVMPIDAPQSPSKVFVVELAQPREDAPNGRPREGVLVYSVNSTVPTGHSPVVVHPKIDSSSLEQGYLFEAPYGVGDTASVVDGNSRLTATVLQQFGAFYHLKLSYTRQ